MLSWHWAVLYVATYGLPNRSCHAWLLGNRRQGLGVSCSCHSIHAKFLQLLLLPIVVCTILVKAPNLSVLYGGHSFLSTWARGFLECAVVWVNVPEGRGDFLKYIHAFTFRWSRWKPYTFFLEINKPSECISEEMLVLNKQAHATHHT